MLCGTNLCSINLSFSDPFWSVFIYIYCLASKSQLKQLSKPIFILCLSILVSLWVKTYLWDVCAWGLTACLFTAGLVSHLSSTSAVLGLSYSMWTVKTCNVCKKVPCTAVQEKTSCSPHRALRNELRRVNLVWLTVLLKTISGGWACRRGLLILIRLTEVPVLFVPEEGYWKLGLLTSGCVSRFVWYCCCHHQTANSSWEMTLRMWNHVVILFGCLKPWL